MRNIIFLLVLLCLYLNTAMAQSPGFRSFNTATGELGALQSMPTNAIADDFGPRNLGRTYWHGDVDFNSIQNDGHADVWDLIISARAGIIAEFDRF